MKKKVVIVHQKDIKDCGACCLQSIIKFYDGYVPLEKIREDTYTSKEGTSLYHLGIAAESYGFDYIAKKEMKQKLNDLALPAIVHVKYENGLTHFMCLYYVNNKNVILMDPAVGKVKMEISKFNEIFTGITLELIPKNKIIYLEKESSIYDIFVKIFALNKKLCIHLLITSLILTIFSIISGLYFKIIYSLSSSDFNKIKFIIYLFLIVVILKVYSEYIKNYYENHLSKNIDVNLYDNFIKHIFNLPFKVINNRSTGEIITRISELNNIKELFIELFISCFLDIFFIIGSFVVLFLINKYLCLFLVVLVIIYSLVIIITHTHLYKRAKQNINYQTAINAHVAESIDMLISVKNLNKTNSVLSNLEEHITNYLYDTFSLKNFLNSLEIIQDYILEIGLFCLNTYGFILIFKYKITMVDLMTFNTILYYFIEPIKKVILLLTKYNFLRASFNKIAEFIDLEEEKIVENEFFTNGDITFENVCYSYNNYFNIIDNFNLHIKAREKIMLKGKSGSGKSTICQMLNQTLKPMSGKIIIDNKNIADYNIYTLRKHVTYVGQKENLYSDTIKNNILFFDKENELFNKICEVCFIEDIISKKVFRYEYGISNNCDNLSGGEKQRIILARALLKSGDIIILDEALSEVDYYLEQKIIKNIKKYFSEKTIIYITHKKHDNLFERIINI